jgi:Flp pilus assembly pilin Flp
MKRFFTRSWHEEQGADSAEYALMFALICVVVIVVLQVMGSTLKTSYANAS